MAVNGDNSKNMSAEDIKRIWTSAIGRQTAKMASDLKYDKTILATIQFCSDASIGQYKIKYQNGYYTAYALDKDSVYSQGTTVYVTVPENNMNNRMIITGSVSNDNSTRTFVTNLEGDQQYGVTSENLIILNDQSEHALCMSSYEPNAMLTEPGYTKPMYSINTIVNENTVYVSPASVLNAISATKAGEQQVYLRFGATFKTEFKEYRKRAEGCDWGIRINLRYDNKDQLVPITLSTYNLIGSPFDFTSDSTRYIYFALDDPDHFQNVESIEGFAFGFPPIDEHDDWDASHYDIHIKDLTLQTAQKIYSYDNNKYVLGFNAPKGLTINAPQIPAVPKIEIEGTFMVDGKMVDTKAQNLQFYWGLEDVSVNSVGHGKYNQYLGLGWRCINPWYLKEDNETTDPSQVDTEGKTYSDMPPSGASVGWYGLNPAVFDSTLIPIKACNVKIVALYENIPYSITLTVFNAKGQYVLIKSINGTRFFNGTGSTSLVAGVFSDETNIVDLQEVTTVSNFPVSSEDADRYKFIWEENTSSGARIKIPPTDNINLLLNDCSVEWAERGLPEISDLDPEIDELIDITNDADEIRYLNDENLVTCIQRYHYYNSFVTDENAEQAKKTIASRRLNAIPTQRLNDLNLSYRADNTNIQGDYILGPSLLTAKHIEGTGNAQAEIDTVTNYYCTGSTASDWDTYKKIQNTLYNIKISKIVQYSTYKVTIIKLQDNKEFLIGTQSITLTNTAGNKSYYLEIANGTQNFLYSAGGVAPTSETNPYANASVIHPLHFILYKSDGSIVVDSSSADTTEKELDIVSKFKPVWKFPIKNTMVKTNYVGSSQYEADPGDTTMGVLYNATEFVYNIAEDFNRNYINHSNISLEISYNGEIITGSTNFTFNKQGDMGTNGTNRYLAIEDPIFIDCRESILSTNEYSKFTALDNNEIIQTYEPVQRHLKNGYLYATQYYTREQKLTLLDSGDAYFANLKFARDSKVKSLPNNKIQYVVDGDTTIQLYGYWYEGDNIKEPIQDGGTWTILNQGDVTPNGIYTIDSSFRFGYRPTNQEIGDAGSAGSSQASGPSANLGIPQQTEVPVTVAGLYYKPTPIIIGYKGNEPLYRVANNAITCTAEKEYDYKDKDEDKKLIYRSHGYYAIPYFYFHCQPNNGAVVDCSNDTFDPTQYFIVLGGYDEVVYDEKGCNPEYNKQEPFSFRVFDIVNHNDVTNEVLADPAAVIDWHCSYGFDKNMSRCPAPNLIPLFENINENQELIHQYCKHNGKVYRCIKNYKKSQKVRVKVGNKIETYDPSASVEDNHGMFIDSYWELISETTSSAPNSGSCDFVPNANYDTLAFASGFACWVSLEVQFNYANYHYEMEALLPINVLCNPYGSDELNAWDGKTVKIGDSYILSSSVSAGEKTRDNEFTGITIGKTMYKGTSATQLGVIGYGKIKTQTDEGNPANRVQQTLFLDANTGAAFFGPNGGSQIILNPNTQHIYDNSQDWSRLAGWYFSRDFLYKPVGGGNYPQTIDYLDYDLENFEPPSTTEGSVGLYVPFFTGSESSQIYGNPKHLDYNTRFIWASCATTDTALLEGYIDELTDKKHDLQQYDSDIHFNGWTITNQTQIILKYDQPVADWNNVIRLLKRFKADPSYSPHFVTIDNVEYVEVERQTGNDSSISIDNGDTSGSVDNGDNNSGSGSSGASGGNKSGSSGVSDAVEYGLLLKTIYDDEVDPYKALTSEEIQRQIETDQVKLASAVEQLRYIRNKINIYNAVLDSYRAEAAAQPSGHPTTWEDFDSTQDEPNFYVTYGGHLHAQSADIRGKINAVSGSFGHDEGDKIQIAWQKDGQRYIFYNKNFWVKDSSQLNPEDPSVYMKGTIMANSGQFGNVGEDKTGKNGDVLFIQYQYYPWYLLKSKDLWCKDYTLDPHPPAQQLEKNWVPHADDTQAKTRKYLFYNKNFWLDTSGNSFFQGTVFGYAGRIGNWNMNVHQIWDPVDTIRLKPGFPDDRGYIQVGTTFITDDGRIINLTHEGLDALKRARNRNRDDTIEGGRPFLIDDINECIQRGEYSWILSEGHLKSLDGSSIYEYNANTNKTANSLGENAFYSDLSNGELYWKGGSCLISYKPAIGFECTSNGRFVFGPLSRPITMSPENNFRATGLTLSSGDTWVDEEGVGLRTYIQQLLANWGVVTGVNASYNQYGVSGISVSRIGAP